MILNRPVPRWHLLSYKWAACVVYTFVLMAFFGISSVLVASLFQGFGGLFVFMPLQNVFAVFPPGEGLYRITLGMLLLGAMLCTVSSIGFLCSCLSIKPAAASILTLSFIYADFVLYNLPYFSDYRHHFMHHYISQWTLVFESPISAHAIIRALLPLWATNFSCFILGVVIFTRQDFKS
jgi:ABC-2 type transport system permease protein